MLKNKTIGIVGAGQLGRMMALAGIPMGLSFEFLDPNPHAPASAVGKLHVGAIDDLHALENLARRVDIMTFEVENVPANNLAHVQSLTCVCPSSLALETAQDRLLEKKMFQHLRIPTPRFTAVTTIEELREAIKTLGYPCVLKTRRLGYDGRGQNFIHQPEDIERAWHTLNSDQLIVEEFVHFDHELSIIVARNSSAQTIAYPLAQNVHTQGILHFTRAPFVDPKLYADALMYAQNICDHFDYVGVLTIEFFCRGGTLLANEIAPRVHNSGHWTIEGAATSQFENHLRAILDLPLGDTTHCGYSAMVNFLGNLPEKNALLSISCLAFHDYNKTPRPARKLGHATIVAPNLEQREEAITTIETLYQAEL